MSAEDLRRAIVGEDEFNIMDEDDKNVQQEIQEEQESLITEILLTELNTMDHIDIDISDAEVKSEIRSISQDIMDITG